MSTNQYSAPSRNHFFFFLWIAFTVYGEHISRSDPLIACNSNQTTELIVFGYALSHFVNNAQLYIMVILIVRLNKNPLSPICLFICFEFISFFPSYFFVFVSNRSLTFLWQFRNRIQYFIPNNTHFFSTHSLELYLIKYQSLFT